MSDADSFAGWAKAIGRALQQRGFVALRRSSQRGDRWVLETEQGLECDLMDKLPDILGSVIAAHYPNRKKDV